MFLEKSTKLKLGAELNPRGILFLKKKKKQLQNQNQQPQNKEDEIRCVQIIYWTSTCSDVTSHFQDMHLMLKQLFFSVKSHIFRSVWGKSVEASNSVLWHTFEKKSRINRLLSFLKRQTQDRTLHSWRGAQDTQCSNKPPAAVQTALIPSHCTLMILGCCSFSRIAISWVTLPRSGSSTQQSSSTLSFQMNFTTTYTDNSIQHHLPKHGFECQLSEFPGNLLVPHITRGMEVTQSE